MIVSRVLLELFAALKIQEKVQFHSIYDLLEELTRLIWMDNRLKGWTRIDPHAQAHKWSQDRNDPQIVLYITWFRAGNGRLAINEGIWTLEIDFLYFCETLWFDSVY